MRTNFTAEQLSDPGLADAAQAVRACVHCGMCNATCPTYQVVADERDGPRGRIQIMQAMLEKGGPPSDTAVRHVDRCLSCLSCRTTCPSSVDYSRLVDRARVHIAQTYQRPAEERWFRTFLATVLPRPGLFRWAVRAAPLARMLPDRFKAMAALAPAHRPSTSAPRPAVYPAIGPRRMRVALMRGCVQRVLAPEIDQAAIRVLNRLGAEVVVLSGEGCCGALNHHMGLEASARRFARTNVAAWTKEQARGGLDRIVSTTSGCGSVVKDYAHLLQGDAAQGKAEAITPLVRDITEIADELGYKGHAPEPFRVAYHAACSLQHGQRVVGLGERLLGASGFEIVPVRDPHLCCGSAGHYSLLQPEMAGTLRSRKLGTLSERAPDLIASGNIGCLEHMRAATTLPMVHTVELLDWASGGRRPVKLEGLAASTQAA